MMRLLGRIRLLVLFFLLITDYCLLIAAPAQGAITYLRSCDVSVNGSLTTVSGPCTCGPGANIMVAFAFVQTASDVVSLTYNGVALTQAGSKSTSSPGVTAYYLINPYNGGSATLAISSSTADYYGIGANCYSGAATAGQPDSTSTPGTTGQFSNMSISLTPNTTGVFVVGGHREIGGNNWISSLVAPTVARLNGGTSDMNTWDSNGAVGTAGSAYTSSSSNYCNSGSGCQWAQIAILVAGAGPPPAPPMRLLMGVGN